MIPEVSAKKQREGEHLEALMDWAVMGATVASNHQSAEAQAAKRVTGTLTLNGKAYRGLRLDTQEHTPGLPTNHGLDLQRNALCADLH